MADFQISSALTLHLADCQRQQIQAPGDETALAISSFVQDTTSAALAATGKDEQSTEVDVAVRAQSDPTEQDAIVSVAEALAKVNAPACSVRHCCCSCHLTGNIFGRFWGLEYTPLSVLLRKCNNEWCTSRRVRCNIRLAFSKYGIPWAVTAGLDFISEAGGCAIRPALQMQKIVNYTSPGFEILWLCKNFQISLSEARMKFTELYRSDPSLKHHVNPAGKSYTQVEFLTSFEGPTSS